MALDRAQLLASVQALGTDHAPALLEARVDAYLARPLKPHVSKKPPPPGGGAGLIAWLWGVRVTMG